MLVRFRCWQEIIDESPTEEPDFYSLTAAMQLYTKGVAQLKIPSTIPRAVAIALFGCPDRAAARPV